MNCNTHKNIIENIFAEGINETIKSNANAETEIYLVGGYIRDALLNKSSCDKDYVIKGESAIEFAKKIADKIDGYYVLLDDEYDIARVVMPDKINYLDFAGCFGNDIYDDLNRRDFTINSIALRMDKNMPELIDPNSGMVDIDKRIVKAISEKNIIDDPLRTLRAHRFSAQLGFEIEQETSDFITKHKALLNNVANERIHAELIKLFEGDNCFSNLVIMKQNGLLYEIFPELLEQIKIPPNIHHHLCLIDHSIETVNQVEKIIKTLPDWVQDHLNQEQATGIKYISLLKIAALLHDLGKPATWNIDEDGRHRFIKHDDVGAQISVETLRRLKFSKNAQKYITKLIRFHIYPSQLIRPDEPPTEKAMMRMFRRLSTETPDVIVIAMADRLSARGPEITDKDVSRNLEGLREFLDKYKESKEKVDSLPKLLTGKEVMSILAIPAGPKVGMALGKLKEAQICGDVNTKEEAVAFVRGLFVGKNNQRVDL